LELLGHKAKVFWEHGKRVKQRTTRFFKSKVSRGNLHLPENRRLVGPSLPLPLPPSTSASAPACQAG
jgi:hypothetical protein